MSYVQFLNPSCMDRFSLLKQQLMVLFIYTTCWSKYLFPWLEEDFEILVFQQDGVPPNRHREVQRFLNEKLPKVGLADVVKMTWLFSNGHLVPPTLLYVPFFLWGYVKDKAYIPPIAQTLQDLRERNCVAETTINQLILARVWAKASKLNIFKCVNKFNTFFYPM